MEMFTAEIQCEKCQATGAKGSLDKCSSCVENDILVKRMKNSAQNDQSKLSVEFLNVDELDLFLKEDSIRKGRFKPVKGRKELLSSFRVIHNDDLYDQLLIDKMVKFFRRPTSDIFHLHFRGSTIFGDEVFPFPVGCNAARFLNFTYLCDRSVRRRLFKKNITYEDFLLIKPLFDPHFLVDEDRNIINRRLSLFGFSWPYYVSYWEYICLNIYIIVMIFSYKFNASDIIFLVFNVLLCYFPVRLLNALLIHFVYNGNILLAARGIGVPIIEEIIKSHTGCISFGIVEYVGRSERDAIVALLPLCLHLVTSGHSFWFRVVQHFIYNAFIAPYIGKLLFLYNIPQYGVEDVFVYVTLNIYNVFYVPNYIQTGGVRSFSYYLIDGVIVLICYCLYFYSCIMSFIESLLIYLNIREIEPINLSIYEPLWHEYNVRLPGMSVDPKTLKVIEECCFWIDIIRKSSVRDYVGVSLSLGMRCQVLVDRFQVQRHDLVKSLVNDLGTLEMESENAESDEVMLNKDSASFLYSWVPDKIRASSTFKKGIAVLIMLFSSTYFSSSGIIYDLRKFFEDSDFMVKGDIFTTVFMAFKSVVKGISRVVETGDFNAFWEMPKDVEFVTRASRLLYAYEFLLSPDEIISNLAEANDLILGRAHLVNSPEIVRLIDKLHHYMLSKKAFLEANKSRDQPIVWFLIGPPGGGKTTWIDQMSNALAVRANFQRVDGDTIKYDIFDKFPVATGAHKNAVFLVMNDITDNYMEFDKIDKMPFEIIMQKIVDTFPCSIRSPKVDDKGVVFNGLKYIFVTANHRDYVFPSSAEKLQRRLDYGILAEVQVVRKGKVLEYDEFSALSQGVRNELTRFTIQKVFCKGNHMNFVDTELKLDLRGFYKYSMSRVASWEIKQLETKTKFSKDAVACSCGLSLALHVVKDDRSEAFSDNLLIFRSISEKCDDFIQDDKLRECNGFSDHFFLSNGACSDLLFYGFTSDFMFISSMLIVFTMFLERCGVRVRTENAVREATNNWAVSFLSLAIKVPAMNTLLKLYDPFRYYQVLAYIRYKQVRAWVEDYRVVLAGASIIGSIVFLMRKKNDEKMLAKPIYKENVDPNSVAFFDYKTEVNFPPSVARNWGKNVMPIQTVNLRTRGVADDYLAKICLEQLYCGILEFDRGNALSEKKKVRFFALSPEYLIFNKHYFEIYQKGDKVSLIFHGTKWPFDITALKSNNMSELCLYKHSFPLMSRGLHVYLPDEQMHEMMEVRRADEDNFKHSQKATFTYNGIKYNSIIFDGVSKDGDCCTPVIGRVPGGSFLLGFISYGSDSGGYVGATLISKEWLDEITSRDPYPFVEDIRMLNRQVEPLSIHSDGRNLVSPFLIPIGSTSQPNNSFKSDFRKTVLYDDLIDKVKIPYAIPLHTRLVKDGNYKSSFLHTFKNINLHCDITAVEEHMAVRSYVNKVTSGLRGKGIVLGSLSLLDAIFGSEQLGIDRVDFKTSCGPELKMYGIRNKYDVFEEFASNQYRMHPEVKNMLIDMMKLLKDNICIVNMIQGVIKDEIRPKDKIDEAKLRIFTVLNFAFNIIGRMLLMPLMTVLLNNPEFSECCGGINAGSYDWRDMANRLLKFPNYFDIDFSTFDVCHCVVAFRMFAMTVHDLLKNFDASEKICKLAYTFVMCMCWQLFVFKNDEFLKFKGMPSGVIFTLILNSVVNSLLLRIAYLRLFKVLNDFDSNVNTNNVGDDNVSSVSDFRKDMNMISLQPIYLNMGYVITPASKRDIILPFLPFEELTFLKRKIVKHLRFGFVAPIDTDSIFKALMFEKIEAGISPVARLNQVMLGAQREMFLHGKEAFIKFQDEMSEIFKKRSRSFEKLDFDALVLEYEAREFVTFMM